MNKAFLGPKARRFLKKCKPEIYMRLREKIRNLEHNPFPTEVERIKGLKGRKAFRVRVGDYRIQYVVYQDKNEILVFKIKRREKAYN